jgi:hypothetical protein
VIVGGVGFTRIRAQGGGARVTCKVGANQVFLRGSAIGYATSHGCKKVSAI